MMIVLNVILVILLFGVTVFVHELGHYLVARWLGLVVDVFAIGFGPSIWKKKINGVIYKIGCLPIGGYVALPQLDPSQVKAAKEEGRELPKVAAWKKIPVAFAGAFFNILFALLIAYGVYWAGKSQVSTQQGCVIGYVLPESVAYESGLRPGDAIVAVNETAITRWDEFILESALTENVTLSIRKKDGADVAVEFETHKLPMGGRIVDGLAKQMPCLVIKVRPGTPAEKAGIQPNDLIVEFANEPIYSGIQLTDVVNQHSGKEASVVISRNGEKMTLSIVPEFIEEYDRALIGIEFNSFDVYRRPMDQMIGWADPVFRLLRALVTPKEAKHAASSVGGPLAILEMIWSAIRSSLLLAVWFIGMLNVNLAILNLLPIPVLDGGHIIFALWEVIFRKPIHEKIVNGLTALFGTLLIGLLILLTVKDAKRIIMPRFQKSDEPAVEQSAETNGISTEAVSE